MKSIIRKFRPQICVLAAVLSLLLWVTDARSQNLQVEPYRIGAFLAVTGQGAFLGAPALATLRLYVDLLNTQGGLLGRPLQLIHYDVGIDAKTAQRAVVRLIETDQVDVIIGGSTTGVSMAVLPMVQRAEIPFISLAESAAIIDPVRKWVFKTAQTGRMACAKILQDVKNNGLTNIALLSGDGGFGQTLRNHCQTLAKSLGLAVLVDETYKSETRRYSRALSKIKDAPGVEAVLNLGFGSTPAFITRTYRELRINAPLYLSHASATQDYLDLAGPAAEGVRLPVAPIVLFDKLLETDPLRPVIETFRTFYERRWEVPATVYGGYAHDAIQMLVAAVRRGRGFAKDLVRRELERTNGLVGVNGIFRLSPEDHLGFDLSAFRMAEVVQGEFVPAN